MSLLVTAAAIADLCAAPLATEPGDRDDAASYVAVGDEAAAAGDARVAVTAYRKALALDPDATHAREALAALCTRPAEPEEDPALGPAIAAFRRGELDEASAALVSIAARGGPSAATAHFFLGVIALGRHAGGEAVRELEAARTDAAYSELAVPLLRLAHRDGTIAAVALVAAEFDTNPQLLPDTPPAGASTGPRVADEDLLAVGTITARPTRWLVLRDVLVSRTQRQLSSFDFLGDMLELATELDGRADHLAIRYALDEDLLGGDAYLFANRGTLAARHDAGAFSLAATYTLRRRDYQRLAQAPFDGWVHAGDAGVIVHATPRVDLDVRATAVRELTADAEFSDLAVGGQIALRARVGSRTRIAGTLDGWFAHYDGPEPDGDVRRDVHGEAAVDAEVDLADHVTAVCGASVLGNRSTVEDFRYWKLVARCGIALAIGGP